MSPPSSLAEALAGAGVDEVSATAQLGNSAEVRAARYRRALDPARLSATLARSIAPQPTDGVIPIGRGRRGGGP